MKQLAEAITDDGIPAINFFNGRLLSGEDLSQDRAGSRELLRRLGRALGAGVAYGLEVVQSKGKSSPSAPVVTVNPGLAVNRNGRPLALTVQTDLRLGTASGSAAPPPAAGFGPCQTTPPDIVIDTGVYLLVMSPASTGQGRAPVNGLNNVLAPCNTNYTIEGVQFRKVLLPLTPDELQKGDLLRNYVAYLFFGTADPTYQQSLRDPFGTGPGDYGLFTTQRGQKLISDCDVPLALISWTKTAGVQFIDPWSVRRRVTRRDHAGPWAVMVDDRRRGEAEAMFLQFQDHVRDLAARAPNPASLTVDGVFDYLPPVGLLPVRSAAVASGFDLPTFFGTHASQDVAMIDAAQLRALTHEALSHEPIDVGAVGRVQLYLVWETVLAQKNGQSVQAAAVFASPTLPYRGVARFGTSAVFGFDPARWGRSRFAPRAV
jgi:hypothetical protein